MPLKLNVGLSKKVGLPDYGSLGASCNVEYELGGTIPGTNMDRFYEQVRETFAACSKAVHDELARQQNANGSNTARQPAARRNAAAESSASPDSRNGNGPRATTKQLDYAGQLAGQIRGLGVRRLETLVTRMFDKPLADLTSLEASNLIDTLKDIKAGRIDGDAALSGAAA